MATNYPTTIDTLTNPTATDKVADVSHSSQHTNINDGMEAVQAKVGADSSAVETSHDFKLSGVTSTGKAVSTEGTQTISGDKTLSGTNVFSGSNTFGSADLKATRPQVTTSIDDANGNEVIETPATASAVNHFALTNSATGNDVDLAPAGSDTDVGIQIKGKGTGKVKIGDADLQYPDVDGTTGQFLNTDGAGVLGWGSSAGSGSTVTSVTLTTAQVKALDVTPIEVVPTAGAGEVNIIEDVVMFLNYATTTYTSGSGSYKLVYNGQTTNLIGQVTFTTFIQATADAVAYAQPAPQTSASLVITTGIANSIDITTSTAAATGDSPITVYVKYRTITLA